MFVVVFPHNFSKLTEIIKLLKFTLVSQHTLWKINGAHIWKPGQQSTLVPFLWFNVYQPQNVFSSLSLSMPISI